MSVATLDTLAVVKQLKAAGFTDDQAEAVTRVVREAQDIDLTNLATKADLLATRADLKADIAETKAEIIKWMFTMIGVQTFAILGAAIALMRIGLR